MHQEMGIIKEVLPNGLVVLLKEMHTAPLISHWIWYRVGSRCEKPGITGISHWVEHMQFKGTPQFPNGVLDRVISRYGGIWNAFTYLDWTTYFETLPADKIEIALRLEADRMVNSLFDPQEVAAERTVIMSERRGNENEPLFRLGERVRQEAFQGHPYRHEIIGSMEDLQKIQRDQLYAHYRRYYVPRNAVLTIAGDFDTAKMLRLVSQWYASISPGEASQAELPADPPLAAEQRFTLIGPGETVYIEVAYRTPPATHPDFFPLMVLDSLLSGPSNLNLMGGGLSNKTSRLYQALVEGEWAVSVTGGMAATIDPYLFNIILIPRPDKHPDKVIEAMDAEILRLQESPPSPEELARAMKQARALFAYGSENITNQAFWLGLSEMIESYGWFLDYLNRLEAVSAQEVTRVAQEYLSPSNRVLGIYLPESGQGTHHENA